MINKKINVFNMEEGDIIVLIILGIILVLNLVSLILVYTTKVGRYFYDSSKVSKAYRFFYNFWMMFTGVTFWLQVLYVRIRYGKVWEK